MGQAVITQTVLEPTVADIRHFVINGDFTQDSGITVTVGLDLKNNDGSVNREMTFKMNATSGQKNHFITDVNSALSTIISDVESILGVTFA